MGRRKGKMSGIAGPVGVVASVILVCVLALAACGSDVLDRARELEDAGDLAGAVTAYEEVLLHDPDNEDAVAGLALDLFLLQRYDEALPFQERLAILEPEDSQVRLELAFNYLNHQDRPTDAVRAFSEAVDIDRTAKHLCFLAQAERMAGLSADAEQHLLQAIEREPSYQYSYQLLYSLLIEQGRQAEADYVRGQAEAAGLTLEETSP